MITDWHCGANLLNYYYSDCQNAEHDFHWLDNTIHVGILVALEVKDAKFYI